MQTPARPSWDNSAHLRRIFNLLVIYRWLSLVPPLIFIGVEADSRRSLAVLLLAAASNLIITLLPDRLNRLLRRWPLSLGVDLGFCAALIAFSGGARSPYYLYSLSPLLSAAFFFQVRGALVAAAGFTALFVAALVVAGGPPDGVTVTAQIVGFFLIGGVFGYQPTLLSRLSGARDDLERAHRDLEIIHQLTVSLQSAADVYEVEDRVLDAITGDLGFARAIIALVDQNERVITAWLGRARDGRPMFAGGLPHPARVPLAPEGGAIARCLLEGASRLAAADAGTSDEWVNGHLGTGCFHIFPMILRENPVGVLLVEAAEADDPVRLGSLQAIAGQAAVALGTTLLCIDRAQRLAVQEERNRFARELHDTVSQSLFGIVFALDGLGKLLPGQPETVKTELEQVKAVAETTRVQMRQSILDMWPSTLTSETFEADLRRFVEQMCRVDALQLEVAVQGVFSQLSPFRQRSLYRIAQEALTNVVKHANASRVEVALRVDGARAELSVRDDGRGFDSAAALSREHNREHFGLKGIAERASTLGGDAEFQSAPGRGAAVVVRIPVADGR